MTRPKQETAGSQKRKTALPTALSQESPIRTRTRNRMHQLLLTAAAVGTGACSDHPIVCDPLPAPATCKAGVNVANNRGLVPTLAARLSTGQVRVTISVVRPVYGGGADASLTFAADPQLTGASLVRIDRQATQIEFECVPVPGATAFTIFVPMTCDAGAISACYRAQVDLKLTDGTWFVVTPLGTTC